MLRPLSALAALLVAVTLSPRARADERLVGLPEDVKFVVRLDVSAVRDSKVGGQLFDMLKAKTLEEVSKDAGGKAALDDVVNILGFDPFEEVQGIVVAAADYQSPERSLVAAVELRQTSGNLEGLVLTLPQYDVETYGEHRIHSAVPERGQQLFAAVHASGEGRRTVIMAAQRDAVVRFLDGLDGKPVSGSAAKTARLAGARPALASLQVFELPTEMIGEAGPQANVAKIISRLALDVTEADGKVHFHAEAAAAGEQQAEQLKQMVQGLIAMVNLKASSDPDDADALKAQQLLKDVSVERSGATVELTLSLPVEEAARLIEEGARENP